MLAILVGLVAAPRPLLANDQGFSLLRYEPTPAGEWSFMVDHPWYSKSRLFAAAGLTLDYAHDPLVSGIRQGSSFMEQQAVIAHALTGHVDLAGSFLDRVNVSLSLPVVLLERGTPGAGVSPIGGVAVGDLRIGAMVRLWGQPLRDAFSIHLGAQIWAPIGAGSDHAGEGRVRAVIPRLVMGGLRDRVLWSFTGSFIYRPDATVGTLPPGPGNSIGPEWQFGAAVGYMDWKRRFSIAPEAALTTVVTDGHAFEKSYTSLEILLGAQYNIVGQVQIGVAGGVGLLREPGTPDFRLLFRLAYAPMDRATAPRRREPDRPPPVVPVAQPAPAPVAVEDEPSDDLDDQPPTASDRDHDQVLDPDDACPDQPGAPSPDPKKNGCPGLVEIKGQQIVILQQVFFATNKATLLEKSTPVLQAVADTLAAQGQIKRVRVEGHTDDRGKADKNRTLSEGRARSVVRWLIEHGVAPDRLEAKGYGPDQPLQSNRTAVGRAANRRVEFHIIVDPAEEH